MTPTERARTTRRRRLAHLGVGGVLAAVAGSQAGALIAESGRATPTATESATVVVREPLPPKPRPVPRVVTRSHVRTPKPRPVAPAPRRSAPHRRLVLPPSSAAWAHTRKAIGVANCESGPGPHEPRYDRYVGDPHLRDPNGHDGKWQFAPSTWRSVGGTGNAADATEAEQDYRAWRLWLRDGWGPWECAGMV